MAPVIGTAANRRQPLIATGRHILAGAPWLDAPAPADVNSIKLDFPTYLSLGHGPGHVRK